MDNGPGGVQALLLREAQQEIASLRTELYTTRRLAEDRRLKIETLTAANEGLSSNLLQLEQRVNAHEREAQHHREVQATLAKLQEELSCLKTEYGALRNSRDSITQELQEEIKAKRALEDTKAIIETERSRLQKSRDELLAQLRVAQQKVAEAEEEQVKAEQDAAALRAELMSMQTHSSKSPLARTDSSRTSQDIVVLVEHLEQERSRAAGLLSLVNSLKAEKLQLQTQLQQKQNDAGDLQSLQQEVEVLRSELLRARSEVQELQLAAASKPEASELPPHKALTRVTHSPAPSRQQIGSAPDLTKLVGDINDPEVKAEIAKLSQKMAMYKSSRDKLLSEVDSHAQEIDRLAYENRVLAQELLQTKEIAQKWENQAQDGIVQVDKLKDLLEESATWQLSLSKSQGNSQQPSGGDEGLLNLQSNLLQEKARSAHLELQVRALAAELVRNHAATLELRNSVLPVLKGFESKLTTIAVKNGAEVS